MAPNLALALAHGVLGQLFLAVMVAMAVVTSALWFTASEPQARPYAKDDRTFQRWLIATMIVQLVLGAAQRHLAALLIVHISLATVVVLLALMVGGRAWGFSRGSWPVERMGKMMISLISIQVVLGIMALAVTQGRATVGSPTTLEVTITTAHQATGALLLALAVALHLWTQRLFRPAEVESVDS